SAKKGKPATTKRVQALTCTNPRRPARGTPARRAPSSNGPDQLGTGYRVISLHILEKGDAFFQGFSFALGRLVCRSGYYRAGPQVTPRVHPLLDVRQIR